MLRIAPDESAPPLHGREPADETVIGVGDRRLILVETATATTPSIRGRGCFRGVAVNSIIRIGMTSARPPLPEDRPLHLRRRLGFLSAAIASYLLLLALQARPWITERAYSTTISPAVARGLSRLTGLVPFSLFEIILAVEIGRAHD